MLLSPLVDNLTAALPPFPSELIDLPMPLLLLPPQSARQLKE
jgi:hypothetical protein